MIDSQATDGVKKLVQVFVDKGYALKSSAEPVQFLANQRGGKLRVSSIVFINYGRQLFIFLRVSNMED